MRAARVTLGGADSAVGTVTAEAVTVGRTDGGEGRLQVERVRGSTVDVAHTTAGTVEGGAVTVGPGCEVEVIRAPGPDVHEDATGRRVERPA